MFKVEVEEKMEIEKREDPGSKGQFVAQTSTGTSSKSNRLLQHLNTHISVGTEVNKWFFYGFI